MLSVNAPDRNLLLRRALRVADLAESEEHRELRGVVRGYMAKVAPESEVRRLFDSPNGVDRDAWRRLAVDQGLVGLCLPERYGGAGLGFTAMAVVIEELGAALAFPSYLTTVAIGAHAVLAAADSGVCDQYLPAIATGELLFGVPSNLRDTDLRDAVSARGVDGGWRLSGTCEFVVDGLVADVILVVGTTPNGAALFACHAHDDTIDRTAMQTLDLTRRQAVVVFRDAPAQQVAAPEDLPGVLDTIEDLTRVAVAAEQVGGAARALELSVQYAGQRHQFGRPIGSFQAIKHACADMLVDLEAARSASRFAAWAAEVGDGSLPIAAAMAQAVCADTFFRVVSQAVQIHGGMGFTWEHPAHLYFRRAKSDELLLGGASAQRARVADLIGL